MTASAKASTTTTAFDGLLRFAAGAMLGLALVAGTAGPARADVEAGAGQLRAFLVCDLMFVYVSASVCVLVNLSCIDSRQDVVIPVDDKGKTTTLTKACSKSPPCLRIG